MSDSPSDPNLNAAWSLLEGPAARPAGGLVYLCEGREYSLGWLRERAGRFASLCVELGLTPGERLALALPDHPDSVAAFLGAMLSGVIPVLLDPGAVLTKARAILHDCGALGVLAGAGTAWALAAAEASCPCLDPMAAGFADRLGRLAPAWRPHPVRAEAVAFLLYTSGSTGQPKGVIHRHGDLGQVAETYGRGVLGLGPADLLLSASKLFFAYGLGNSLAFPLVTGAAAVLNPGEATPATILSLIERHRPGLFFAVPSLYARLLQAMPQPRTLPGVRLCVSAGEALPAGLLQQWQDWTGLDICDGLGSTEALHIFISNRPGAIRPGFAGQAVPGYEVRTVDEVGQPAAAGQPAYLEIRGPSLTPGYWHRPQQSAAIQRADGWLATGDIVVAEAGWYRHLGRADDLFKAGANWVIPSRIEEVLREHPGVRDSAVVGRPVMGLLRPMAFVVPAGETPPTPAALRHHVLAHLPPYMCPVDFEFCAELPRTETGKLQRFQLRPPADPPAV